jgi:tRNA threonylcarbamoyladenosine biosynthesis protein TsaE
MKTRRIADEAETAAFGRELAAAAKPGTVIALIGELGTGKTTLTKAIARGLGITENITSPTFAIIKEYTGGKMPLYHFDVYRVGGPEDMYNLGFEEYFYGNGLSVVEWADLVEELLPPGTTVIRLEYGQNEGERLATYGAEGNGHAP